MGLTLLADLLLIQILKNCFRFTLKKKKNRVQEIHRARTFWGGRGGDLQPWDESPSVEFSHSYNFSLFPSEKAPLLHWHPAHVISVLKLLYTASLNAMLEAGCPQALARGYLVILWSLALGGGEMRCAIPLQSDEAKEKGWNIAGGYAWCKPKG